MWDMRANQINVLQIIAQDLQEILKKQNFDQLSNDDKRNIVKHLHERWTHPDSEVRNRIKLFAVRSPEILKPILESK